MNCIGGNHLLAAGLSSSVNWTATLEDSPISLLVQRYKMVVGNQHLLKFYHEKGIKVSVTISSLLYH